ncbi:MAG: carbohydrate binding family 9 domain-containing protein, partial [bacterium]|nr:carbohydrate binding family 9 domain-containing protein [bacterium]
MLLFLLSNVCRPVLYAAAAETGGTPLHPLKTKEEPLIDGELNDKAWQKPPLENPFITYSPNFGEVVSEKTLVWMAYDQKNLYFAFKCLDSEPQKIKTSVTQRDQIFNDDWVGLSLDALGNSQTSYHFFVNPSGIQGDELNSAVSGEDRSPDFVWQSAAKVTSEGYQVELAIPLRSIPFTSGEEVKMGVLFWRSHSRLGVSAAWPEIKPGMRIFNSHTP